MTKTEDTQQPPRWMEYMSIDELPAADRNPKGHDSALMGESFDEFGYIDAVIIDERTGKLLSGHGRIERLRWERGAGNDPPDGVVVDENGRWVLPVQRGVRSRNDRHAERMVVAINRVGERGGWRAELATMLDEWVNEDGPEALLGVGYAVDDIDELIGRRPPENDDDAGRSQLHDIEYRIVIECENEQQQGELLARFASEGLTCRAIAQ